jgi:hypothetical protein
MTHLARVIEVGMWNKPRRWRRKRLALPKSLCGAVATLEQPVVADLCGY